VTDTRQAGSLYSYCTCTLYTVQSVQNSERLRDPWMCVEVVVATASTKE
jgi:hypothetical protein